MEACLTNFENMKENHINSYKKMNVAYSNKEL